MSRNEEERRIIKVAAFVIALMTLMAYYLWCSNTQRDEACRAACEVNGGRCEQILDLSAGRQYICVMPGGERKLIQGE